MCANPSTVKFRVTIYSLNCLCLGHIQQQTRLRGLKHARETSKNTSGCLERTSLFKLRRNTQIPDIRPFSIFEIIRKWSNLWQFSPKYRVQWSKWHRSSYINPPAFVLDVFLSISRSHCELDHCRPIKQIYHPLLAPIVVNCGEHANAIFRLNLGLASWEYWHICGLQ